MTTTETITKTKTIAHKIGNAVKNALFANTIKLPKTRKGTVLPLSDITPNLALRVYLQKVTTDENGVVTRIDRCKQVHYNDPESCVTTDRGYMDFSTGKPVWKWYPQDEREWPSGHKSWQRKFPKPLKHPHAFLREQYTDGQDYWTTINALLHNYYDSLGLELLICQVLIGTSSSYFPEEEDTSIDSDNDVETLGV